MLATPVHHISPGRSWLPAGGKELWEFRELLYFLIWREVKVRYKQTALGAAWAVIQPLSAMAIFTVVFGRIAGVPSDGLPYPLFAYCALLPWQLFAFSLSESTSSVVVNQRLLTKVYFPRLILPLSSVGVALLDFGVATTVLVALMAWYGVVPGPALLTVPLWIALAVTAALGAGLWLSALNVRYRDVRYTVPLLAQLWLFASPVAYPTSSVPDSWQMLYALNPMVAVVDGFRWALVGGPPPGPMTWLSVVAVAGLAASGLVYFARTERSFADLV